MGKRRQADLMIIGGGAMGLATAWAAASPERRVVLLERHEPGHKRGASHGTERIFRFGYDKPLYVRLATEADELWRRLESQSRRTLIDRIGAIEHGDPAELAAIAAACRGFDVDVRWYDPAEAKRRWPGHRFTTPVLHQPAAGRVRAADTLVALREIAESNGAAVHCTEPVLGIDAHADGVVVTTAAGEWAAPTAVVTAGAWTATLLEGLVELPPMVTTQEQVAFLRPRASGEQPSLVHRDETVHFGLLTLDGGYKLGEHGTGKQTTGDTRDFSVDEAGLDRLVNYAREWLPGLEHRVVTSLTCLYTTTPTKDFVLDRVGPLIVGAGFSGHGFKFVPRIGIMLARMATGEPPPGGAFALSR